MPLDLMVGSLLAGCLHPVLLYHHILPGELDFDFDAAGVGALVFSWSGTPTHKGKSC